jgi:O-antigen ligase
MHDTPRDKTQTAPAAPEATAPRFAFLDRLGEEIAAPRPAAETGAPPSEGTAPPPAATADQHARLRAAMRQVSGPGDAPATPRLLHDHRTPKSVFAWFLVALVLLAPLPVGSNRPLPWTAMAIAIGLLGLIYMLFAARRMPHAPLRLGGLGALVALALAQPLWGLVQTLPLGSFAEGLTLPADLPPALRPATISLDPGSTLIAALRMAGHAAFFLLALDLMTRPERLLRTMRALFWGITGYAVYGMVALSLLGDTGLWGAKEAYLGYATGPFTNRNSFASFLGIGLILGIALLRELQRRPRMRRPRRHGPLTENGLRFALYGTGMAIVLATLLATGSRMGIAASLAGAVVTFVLMRSPAGDSATSATDAATGARPGRVLAGIAILLVAAGALTLLFGTTLIERSLFLERAFDMRFAIFAQALEMIGQRPLLGYGLDAFPRAFELGRPDSFLNGFIYTDAHSTYLENWVEGGLIFGSVPVVLGAFYLLRLRAALQHRARQIAASAAAAGVFTLAALHSLADFSFEVEANVLLLCLICAMGVSPLTIWGRART